ncbi:MAG: tetratricopeptide repeat protein [Xenococcaceae cyanobacterium]
MGITQANTLGIQGLGGVGKSTLAAYFYHYLDFEAKFWADVSGKPDFTVFAEKIILALGGKVNQPIDITELINNLLSLLSQRRCLLVVDNLETLLDEERNWRDEYYQDFFSRWQQQGTNSTLFITTQDKPKLFQALQHWYTLGGMKIEEGIALLTKLAIQGTEAELKAFVEYVNGHPLTIKLVAGYLREYCDRQLSQVEKLGLEKFDLAYQEAEGLHRNKQDARLSWIIERHLDRLSAEQKQFLTNLSVYRLPFNREAANYQWIGKKVKPIVIQKKLQEFSNRSLLIKTQENKFQFESLVQKYVLQQANSLNNAHQQAIEYYCTNLKEEESWQVLDDVSEYLEIIDHRCELKQYASANESLNICYGFLNLRGYFRVLVEISEKLVQGWQLNLQPEDKSDYAKSLKNLGNAYGSQGEYQQAIDFYQQSKEITREIGDRSGVANSLGNLGNAYDFLGEYQQAINYYQQSKEIKQQIGDRSGVANCLIGLGNVYHSLGEYPRAIKCLKQSKEIKQQIGDRSGVADSLIGLGNAYYFLGEYPRVIDYYQQSLEIKREIGDRSGVANSLNNLGNAYNSQGEYQQAIDYYQQSKEITGEIGDRSGVANSLIGLGNAYNSLGEYQQAIDYLQESLGITQEIGDRSGVAYSLNNLGNAYNSQGDYQQAIDYYQKSLKIKREIGDRNGVANSLNNLGDAYNNLGEYQRAIDNLQQSLEISQQIGTRDIEAESWFNLGDTRKNLQQKSEAKTAYENSRKLYQAMKLDKKVAECDKAIPDLEHDDMGA